MKHNQSRTEPERDQRQVIVQVYKDHSYVLQTMVLRVWTASMFIGRHRRFGVKCYLNLQDPGNVTFLRNVPVNLQTYTGSSLKSGM
jgi:hypothetical protein